MGNLHAGHLSLAALGAQAARRVVMSIFVNPTQFGPDEDYAAYPRTLAADEALIAAAGNVDLLFVPDRRRDLSVRPRACGARAVAAVEPRALRRQSAGAFRRRRDGRVPAAEHRRARRAVLGAKGLSAVRADASA